MRIVFMGTSGFAVPALEALAGAGHEILRVYCRPPRPAGRGMKARPAPVHIRAEALGLPVATPDRFRGGAVEEFAALRAEVAVVAAYGRILPQDALDAPERGCVNLHPSLLPRWRGAAPIQRAIMAGDAETGVCAMRMDAGLDTGPILARETARIAPDDTAQSLHDRLAAIGARLITDILPRLDALTPEPQAETGVAYAARIDKAEARIDWRRDAAELSAHIRGLSPFPGAWCEIRGERCKILTARAEGGRGAPGEILDDGLLTACGRGAVRLTRLQRAGKGPVEAAEFLRGRPVAPGERLA